MRPSQARADAAECTRAKPDAYEVVAAALRAAEDALIERIVAAVREAVAAVPATTAAAPPVAERLLTAEECAERVGVDLRTWRRLEKHGQVPRGLRLGPKVVRWHPAVVDAFARTGVVPPAPIEAEPILAQPTRRRRPSVFAQARAEEKAS